MSWTLQFGPDTFTGADATSLPTHDARWVDDFNGHSIIGNRCHGSAISETHLNVTLAAKQASQGKFYSDSDFHGVGVHYAVVGGGSDWEGVFSFWNSGTVYLYLRSGGSFSLLDSASATRSDGDVLRTETDGAGTYKSYVNGVEVNSASDATLSGGFVAIRGISATYLDDFEAYDEASGGGFQAAWAQGSNAVLQVGR